MRYLLFFFISISAFCQKPCGFKKGLQEGTCNFYYDNGKLKETSTWKEGKTNGSFISYNKDGKITASGLYKNSFKTGKWKYYKEGVLDSEEYYVYKNSFSMLNGSVIFYYPNGTIEIKGNYKDGKAEGKWQSFDKNGKLFKESTFINDKREGDFIYYNVDGSINKIEVYKNGQLITTKK